MSSNHTGPASPTHECVLYVMAIEVYSFIIDVTNINEHESLILFLER